MEINVEYRYKRKNIVFMYLVIKWRSILKFQYYFNKLDRDFKVFIIQFLFLCGYMQFC